MSLDAGDVHAIAQRILAYFNQHPNAADTADGIRDWWLIDEPAGEPKVQAALDWLVAQRLVVASDSRPSVYRLARRAT